MKTIERTFLETTKRFFEPYSFSKMVTVRAVILYTLRWGGTIIHILFVQKIIWAVELQDKENFWYLITFYIGVLIVYYTVIFLMRKWWWVETVGEYRKTIQWNYLKWFITISNTEVERVGTGKTIALMDSWMDIWAIYLDKAINESVKIFTAIAFTLYMIIAINVWYAVIFFILYVFIHIIWELFNKKALIFRRQRQDTRNLYVGYIVKILMSKFEILQTWRIDSELDRVNGLSDKLMDCNRKMATSIHWLYFFPEMFMAVVKVVFFVFLWYQIILWNTTFAIFVWLFGLLTLMDSVIENSMRFYINFTKDFTKIEKLWDFFDSTPEIKGYEEWEKFKYNKWKIELKNIDFWYSEKINIFNNFNLNIEWGKITALVWNSWSWKSTLVKLISGYIRADSGTILVDNQSLEEVSLKSYYKSIGYLTQEPSVFDGTIRENLLYWVGEQGLNNQVHDKGFSVTKDLESVISLAKCEFIYELENGLDTEIWEKWIRLSWGQRQRLAIAKIMLRNPQIIILDEPTSALDSFSEEQITKALNNLFKWRTVIVIAHRLQTVKHAHKILVLENAQVVEEGSHEELVKHEWVYKRMLDLQSWF